MKNPRPSELICVVLLSLPICLGERHELMAQESHMPAFQDRACITAQEVVQNLVRMNAERAEALQAYEGTRVYRLDYRGFPGSRRAEMVVRVKYRSPLTKEFTVVSATGSKLVIEKVFQKLLQAEKEVTRLNDDLARRRRELPWVKVDKDYVFDTVDGEATLADLFRGRSQLIVYHFMYGPD